MESNENACVHHCNLISDILNKQTKEFKNILVNSPSCIILICSLEKEMVNVTWLSGVVKSHHIKEVVNVTFWQWGGETLILHWGW